MIAIACPCCGGAMSPLRYACPDCSSTTWHRLGQIIDYSDILDLTTEPRRGGIDGQPKPRGYSSRPPVSLDRITALDYRSRADGTGPDDDPDEATLSVLGSLHRIAAYVAEELYRAALMGSVLPRPLTVPVLASYLRTHTEWCCHQLWAASYVDTVRALHAQLRRQAGDAPPRSLGACDAPDCGGTVWPVPGGGGRCDRDPAHLFTVLDLARRAYASPSEGG